MRKTLFDVIDKLSQQGPGYFQTSSILREASQQLRIRNNLEEERALLTLFYDLFRNGHLAWGHNLSNVEPPFCHLTDRGRQTLKHLSRDPANPDGYLHYVAEHCELSPIAMSYLNEALMTYNSNCFKATAVMVGAASERTILEIRERLVKRIVELGRSPSRNLKDWKIGKVLTAITSELEAQKRINARWAEARISSKLAGIYTSNKSH